MDKKETKRPNNEDDEDLQPNKKQDVETADDEDFEDEFDLMGLLKSFEQRKADGILKDTDTFADTVIATLKETFNEDDDIPESVQLQNFWRVMSSLITVKDASFIKHLKELQQRLPAELGNLVDQRCLNYAQTIQDLLSLMDCFMVPRAWTTIERAQQDLWFNCLLQMASFFKKHDDICSFEQLVQDTWEDICSLMEANCSSAFTVGCQILLYTTKKNQPYELIPEIVSLLLQEMRRRSEAADNAEEEHPFQYATELIGRYAQYGLYPVVDTLIPKLENRLTPRSSQREAGLWMMEVLLATNDSRLPAWCAKYTPNLLELAKDNDPRIRATTVRVLATVMQVLGAEKPQLVDIIRKAIDDVPRVGDAAITQFARIAYLVPNEINEEVLFNRNLHYAM